MKKLHLLLYCSSFILLSCSNKKNNPIDLANTADSIKTNTEQNSLFPVTSFLKGQMIALDSIPITILQINTINGKEDSTWISKEKIKPLLRPFISDLIDKENLVSFFKESKFNDQTTDAITFTYTPKNVLPDSIALRHWDVYVNPETGTIRRVYIVKQLKENGLFYTQQLTWQTDKWAKIVTIDNKDGGKVQSDVKWIWNFTEQ
jgi:hypothetical protein